jgi:hypothetical protein
MTLPITFRRIRIRRVKVSRGQFVGALEVVDSRYQLVYERTMAVLGGDLRVASVTLTGSVADGTADQWSDLDLVVVTQADDYDAFLADWPTWLAAITPTVFARTPLAPFIINAVTADGLTVDFVVYKAEEPTYPSFGQQYTVGFSRFTEVGGALEYAVAEQLRGLTGPFISLVQRDEHLRYLSGVPHLLGLLTAVFLAETGGAPPAKHWNRSFTEEQRAAVGGLPGLRATRDDVIAWGLGLAELLVTRARPLYETYSLVWPTELAAVAVTRIRENFGIDTSAWLY